MADQPIYITYSDELRREIAKADIDFAQKVKEELAKEGIAGKVEWAPDPTHSGAEDRDVFLVILAVGVTATLVGAAIARVIDAVTQQRRASMVEEDLHVALDGDQQPIRNRAGNPVYNATSTPSPAVAPGREHTSLAAGKLLRFDLSRS